MRLRAKCSLIGLGLGLLGGCGLMPNRQSESAGSELVSVPIRMAKLAGSLNQEPLFHSNSPERVETPGVLLSTLAGSPAAGFLAQPLSGDFSVFFHHIAHTPALDSRRLWLGLLAHNQAATDVTVNLLQANVFLTGPDAPFENLPVLLDNQDGTRFSGPGDRVALASLRGLTTLKPQSLTLTPGENQVLAQWQLPTNPWFFFQVDNALSGLVRLRAALPVAVSLLALYQQQAPQLSDWLNLLHQAHRAGPGEPAASELDAKGRFRYGRVAGIAQGARWDGEITLQADDGEIHAFPIASLHGNQLGTGQNQSAPLLARVPGSAAESHGNFGVHYRLRLRLKNAGGEPRRYRLALQQPLRVEARSSAAVAVFRQSPGASVRFRGSLHLSWQNQEQWFHLSLHEGEQAPAFAELSLPPASEQTGQLEWIYPADATPPQLLTFTPDKLNASD